MHAPKLLQVDVPKYWHLLSAHFATIVLAKKNSQKLFVIKSKDLLSLICLFVCV